MSITITREDSRLFAQATNEARFELFAESAERYFAKVGGIQISFEKDERGRGTALTIRQAGTSFLLKRVEP